MEALHGGAAVMCSSRMMSEGECNGTVKRMHARRKFSLMIISQLSQSGWGTQAAAVVTGADIKCMILVSRFMHLSNAWANDRLQVAMVLQQLHTFA